MSSALHKVSFDFLSTSGHRQQASLVSFEDAYTRTTVGTLTTWGERLGNQLDGSTYRSFVRGFTHTGNVFVDNINSLSEQKGDVRDKLDLLVTRAYFTFGAYNHAGIPIDIQFRFFSNTSTTSFWVSAAQFAELPLIAVAENVAAGGFRSVELTQEQLVTLQDTVIQPALAEAKEQGTAQNFTLVITTDREKGEGWCDINNIRLYLEFSYIITEETSHPLRSNSIFGTLSQAMTASTNELQSDALALLGGIEGDGSSFARVVLDPGRRAGPPEIVYIYEHDGGDTALVARGQEGTTPREHFAATSWEHAPTVRDWRIGAMGDFRPQRVRQPSGVLVQDSAWDPMDPEGVRFGLGSPIVYADTPPTDPMRGTVFVSRSGKFFDKRGNEL